MDSAYKNCQSCGMPLKKDEKGGGTNADGSENAMYCSHCYVNGAFTLPDITADEMILLVKGKLKEFGIPASCLESSQRTFQSWRDGSRLE